MKWLWGIIAVVVADGPGRGAGFQGGGGREKGEEKKNNQKKFSFSDLFL